MLLHTRKVGGLIFAIFALLVFVGITREFMPARWSFRTLRWNDGAQDIQGDVKTPENQNKYDGSAPTVTSVVESVVMVTPVPSPEPSESEKAPESEKGMTSRELL
jgi:hypothetical protein